ncbi:MAG: glycosyltransferase family 2 protein [Lacibacter sp.]
MKEPLVSVLMTAYNRADYISAAIESVLASTYQHFELIIVDDCSADATVAIAEKFAATDSRVQVYVNEQNLGDYKNRNKAASYANGVYLKYLDSDDLIMPWGLEVMVMCMQALPTAGIGFVHTNINLQYPVLYTPSEAYSLYYFQNKLLSVGPSATIIRKNVFEAAGGFSGKQYIGDMELWLNLTAANPVAALPPGLVYWREHEGQQIVEERKNNKIEAVRLQLDRAVLTAVDCPLTAKQRTIALRNLLNIKCRTILARYFLKGKFGKGMAQMQLLNLRFSDMLLAFKRNQKPEN